jgi:hypothetical protein
MTTENKPLFQPRLLDDSADRAKHIFNSLGSAGNNNAELARILLALDFAFKLLNWKDITLVDCIAKYQASVDAKYHNDYKAVATIEELDRRMAMRRATYQQQSQGGLTQ